MFWELVFAGRAGDEINRFPDRHHDPEVQRHSAMSTGRAEHLFESVGDIRLGSEIKLHVGMNWKTVPTFRAHPSPFAVRLHGAVIDREAALFAHRAANSLEPGFDLFHGGSAHDGSG